jgi:NAD(P)-dependent dehydrogenase (short-subunit alcohol dehydrogenase family)
MSHSESSEMSGKVCLVTGANTGIGRATALELARRGARVILASRSEERTRPVLDELAAAGAAFDFVALDLASLDSVRRAGAEVRALVDRLDVLVNNAGLVKRGQTEDGFELIFGVNHLGHFLHTMELLELLVAAAPSRVVNVSSGSHYYLEGFDWDEVQRPTATFTGMREYRISKLANVLFTAELARRLEGRGVTSYAVHPGVIASDVWRRVPWPLRGAVKMFMKSSAEGARTSIHCACDPALAGESGGYYDDCQRREPSALARDRDLAAELWRRSAAWTGADLPALAASG